MLSLYIHIYIYVDPSTETPIIFSLYLNLRTDYIRIFIATKSDPSTEFSMMFYFFEHQVTGIILKNTKKYILDLLAAVGLVPF